MPSQTPSDTSAILGLPYLMPAQAQKHVTHNEALRILDVAVQLAVQDRDRSAPPAGATGGACHIVGAGASGAWAGHTGEIAAFVDGGWEFLAPRPGWRAQVLAEGRAVVWDGSAWTDQVGMLGVNTGADSFNRLAVAAEATLLTHDGAGHQLKVNKAADTDTASLLFQSGWTGHAEMGLAGNTDFSIKTFDGSAWQETLRVDAAAHIVRLGEALHITHEGNAPGPPLLVERYGNGPTGAANFRFSRLRGTPAEPEALKYNDSIAQIEFRGYAASKFSPNTAVIAVKAAEDWDDTANSTRFALELTDIGQTTRREVFTVEANGGAFLEGNEIFHQGNVVGTVSQAGGVPTGAIVEHGSANAGADKYVRYADGTQICWGSRELGSVRKYGSGTFSDPFRSDNPGITFAKAFVSPPAVAFGAWNSGATGAAQSVITNCSGVSAAGITKMQVHQISGYGTDQNVGGSYMAIGRWF